MEHNPGELLSQLRQLEQEHTKQREDEIKASEEYLIAQGYGTELNQMNVNTAKSSTFSIMKTLGVKRSNSDASSISRANGESNSEWATAVKRSKLEQGSTLEKFWHLPTPGNTVS